MPKSNVMKNRFYQLQDAQIGCLCDTQMIMTRIDEARDALRDHVDGYRDQDNVEVERESRDRYVIKRNGYIMRTCEVVGPLTAEDMGYDSPRHLCEVEDIPFPQS